MAHIHKKIHHHLKRHRSHIPLLSSVVVAVLILSGTFFITKSSNPHISELAFTEHSSLGTQAGSVIPASCESDPYVANGDGNYTGCATVTCWNGSVITPAAGQSCPPQVTCSWSEVNVVYTTNNCQTTKTWTNRYSCSDGTYTDYPGNQQTTGTACPAPSATPTQGQCSPMGASGNYPPYGCGANSSLGTNAKQPNGDDHWYCNSTNGGSPSGLCWYVTPATTPTCSAGYTWNGSSCVSNTPSCPGGTYWNGSYCETPPPPPQYVDLLSGAPTPTSATAGTPVDFVATIYNYGTISTGNGFYNFFQVATQADGAGTLTDLASSVAYPVAAYSSTQIGKTHTFTSGGTYSIRVCADKSSSTNAGTITENNENNNCGGWANVTVATNDCSALSAQSWGGNCSSTIPSATHGGYSVVSNTANNDYTGSATWSCSNGAWTGPIDPVCTPFPATEVPEITATPRTVEQGGLVKIVWAIKNPSNDPAKQCKIVAVVQKPAVCDATCQTERNTVENSLNATLSTGTTNANDPNGANRSMSTALNKRVGSTQYARGEKSVSLEYSTTFTTSCGTLLAPVKSIIYVTNRVEG